MKAILTIILVTVTRIFAVCDIENSVELTNRTYNGISYEEGEYFVDNITGIERGCVCGKETCIRKCCPLHQVYDRDEKHCVDFDEKFMPPIHNMESKLITGLNATEEFHLLFNKMTCPKGEVRIALLDAVDDFHVKTDGQLYFIVEENIPSHFVYKPDRYCIDNFASEDNNSKDRNYVFNALVCIAAEPDGNHYALSASCNLISCVLIILVVAVYGFLPQLRTLHGMVLTAYLLSFFVALVFLATMNIMLLIERINQTQCISITFVIYFSLLAAFFWLNVMWYDMWSKFRVNNMAHGFKQTKGVRFLIYSAYAFGIPTILTTLLAVLEFSNLPVNISILPHLRRQGCFIAGFSIILYLYGPMILVCAANVVLFILTVRRIAILKKQSQILNRKDTQRVSLYIKLFVVTGINWLLSVVTSLWPRVPYLWQFSEEFNFLIGIFNVFIVFLFKKKIFIAIKKRYKSLRRQQQISREVNIPAISSPNRLSPSQETVETQL